MSLDTGKKVLITVCEKSHLHDKIRLLFLRKVNALERIDLKFQ